MDSALAHDDSGGGGIARRGVLPHAVGHVVIGNVIQTDVRVWYLSRVAAIDAGRPIETPTFDVNRLCGSGCRRPSPQRKPFPW
ncbi:MAG TPA: hypothetical protein VGJ20_08125 [Xanthobacteraceae bacterium]